MGGGGGGGGDLGGAQDLAAIVGGDAAHGVLRAQKGPQVEGLGLRPRVHIHPQVTPTVSVRTVPTYPAAQIFCGAQSDLHEIRAGVGNFNFILRWMHTDQFGQSRWM